MATVAQRKGHTLDVCGAVAQTFVVYSLWVGGKCSQHCAGPSLKSFYFQTDLREIVTNGGYPTDGSSKLDFGKGLVLQVTNIRNMSAPKSNQESKTSPRLLQIDMTDGQTYCSGLEMEHLPMFNTNIAPGTKVLLRNNVKTIQGMMSLAPQNITILGGKVAALYEKWESNRIMAKYSTFGARAAGADSNGIGPPPWIPFGQKAQLQSGDGDDKTFKSYGGGAGEKAKQPPKENLEFVTLRNEAIAEAMKIGTKKVFGGGNRQLIDHNLKKILDKGYTEEQAKYALKMARNNLERAMSSLKRQNVTESEQRGYEPSGRSNAVGRERGTTYPDRNSGSVRGSRGAKMEEAVAAKPSGKVSLFDYLEDKIKIPQSTVPPTMSTTTAPLSILSQSKSFNSTSNYSSNRPSHTSSGNSNARFQSNNSNETNTNINNNRSKFENNISSSFASRQKKYDDFSHSTNHNNNNHNSPIMQHHSSKRNDSSEQTSHGLTGKGTKSSFPPFPATQQQPQRYNRQKPGGNERENGNRYQSQSNQKYATFYFSRNQFENFLQKYFFTQYYFDSNYQQNNTKTNTSGRYSSAKPGVSVQSNHPLYNETVMSHFVFFSCFLQIQIQFSKGIFFFFFRVTISLCQQLTVSQ